MANLEGMPIGSLPEATDIQDEDEIVVYRPSTGKAYQANTDLIDTLKDISDQVTLVDESASVTAYYKAGWVFIQAQVQAVSGSNTSYFTMPSGYRPSKVVYGWYNANSISSDAGKISFARINASGTCGIWATSDLNSKEFFTFVYPL